MREIELITLTSETGFTVHVLTFGGIIQKVMAKDKHNVRNNVVLNYDHIDDYKKNDLYLGCVVGPVAGRTKKGLIEVDNLSIQLDTSCHPNSLHSCLDGLHLINWDIKSKSMSKLILSHQSKDYKCMIDYEISYSVTGETLSIDYHAKVSSSVYLSLTNHSYFNLTGNPGNQIIHQKLKLNCTHYAKLDEENLPVELVPLTKTALDFSEYKSIKSALDDSSEDIAMASGIDHPFKRGASDTVAELMDLESGIVMKVQTNQPYVVVYTGNFLSTTTSLSGKTFGKHTGICFETQDLPNIATNKLDHIRLVTPESPYSSTTSFAFSTLG
ncbi:MAG: galactose mutarotase [Clostridiales bacterium]|nr:galactose mutarotase [Clostridiales bacterium]